MNKRKKPLSFSLCPLNIAYVLEQVAERQKENSRYSVSQYGDDLITHLRTKAEAKPTMANIATVEKPKVKRFVPPKIDEVKDYMYERVSDESEAEKFCDFYESNGWKVGRNKMKCWKAAVRNWLKNNNSNNQSRVGGKTSGNLAACEAFINGK